jgi:hypothetical protein
MRINFGASTHRHSPGRISWLIDQGPSWEPDSRSVGQGLPQILQKATVHKRVHRNRAYIPVPADSNSDHHFWILHSYTPFTLSTCVVRTNTRSLIFKPNLNILEAKWKCNVAQNKVSQQLLNLRTVRPLYRTVTLRYHPDVAFYIFFQQM